MIEFPGIRALVGELGDLPTAVRANLRREFVGVGDAALASARGNASWSSRIPGAISVRASASQARSGVFLRVDASRAPHARPYEGLSRGGSFRHPVYGTDRWVSQSVRPFLVPAVRAVRADAIQAAEAAVARACRAVRLT